MKKYISNKKWLATIGVLLILSFVLVYFFTCPAYKVIRALKCGDCTEATMQFSKADNSLQHKLVLLLLPLALEDINDTYNDGQLSLSKCEKVYETVASFDLSLDVSEYHSQFKKLAISKASYDNAKSAMNVSDYLTAISNYKAVISKDSLYNIAQQELQKATNEYKNIVIDNFYKYITKGNINGATQIINEALSVTSDNRISKMKVNLTSGVYDKIGILLDKINDWEIITEAHAGENTYCCYRISRAKNNSNSFRCYYVVKSLNSLVQSGNVASIGGPAVWHKISGNTIKELNYTEGQQIEYDGYNGSISWDYTMTELEKFKKLESLFE